VILQEVGGTEYSLFSSTATSTPSTLYYRYIYYTGFVCITASSTGTGSTSSMSKSTGTRSTLERVEVTNAIQDSKKS
jgi:hypothetical protein